MTRRLSATWTDGCSWLKRGDGGTGERGDEGPWLDSCDVTVIKCSAPLLDAIIILRSDNLDRFVNSSFRLASFLHCSSFKRSRLKYIEPQPATSTITPTSTGQRHRSPSPNCQTRQNPRRHLRRVFDATLRESALLQNFCVLLSCSATNPVRGKFTVEVQSQQQSFDVPADLLIACETLTTLRPDERVEPCRVRRAHVIHR